MSLCFTGKGGELRHGRKQLARLATFWKDDKRVTFSTDYVNQFVAGLGPPTEIVLPLTPKAVRIYPVTAGSVESGVVMIDLMQARTETL